MTIYFAPPGEPLDGDNWQELGYLSEDGLQIEGNVRTETIEITPELNLIHALPTKASLSFDFKPSREFTNAFFGFDIYALADTVAEWFTRPPAPMPPRLETGKL